MIFDIICYIIYLKKEKKKKKDCVLPVYIKANTLKEAGMAGWMEVLEVKSQM